MLNCSVLSFSLYFMCILNFQVIFSAMLRGLTDSIKGTFVIFSLDKNIQERAQRTAQLREKSTSGRRKESSSDAIKATPKRQEYVNISHCNVTINKKKSKRVKLARHSHSNNSNNSLELIISSMN